MKKIIIFIMLALTGSLFAGQFRIEGFYETMYGRIYDADKERLNVWDPHFSLETRMIANPVANTEMFLKFYANGDSKDDAYRQDKIMQPVLGEMFIKYRQEKNNNGFEVKLFSRGGGSYWLDGTMLEVLRTDDVKDGDNGQGCRLDFWHNKDGGLSYVFADNSDGSGDDLHLLRLRQNFLDKDIRSGLFFLRKNYPQAQKNDFNQVIAGDINAKFLKKYYLRADLSVSQVPAEGELTDESRSYHRGSLVNYLKSNMAAKVELSGFKIGKAMYGYWSFTPSVWSFGNTYRNYMGNNQSNEFGYRINSYYLVPQRAITFSLNYLHFKKYNPVEYYSDELEAYKIDHEENSEIFAELYLEFVNGFKGKTYYKSYTKSEKGVKKTYNSIFGELIVENKLAKLRLQAKKKDIGMIWEKEIFGIETQVNLTDKFTFFTRNLLVTDRVGNRHSTFYELQYRIFGNTELYMQYGPSGYGSDGLIENDGGFASGGKMVKEIKFIIKGWF